MSSEPKIDDNVDYRIERKQKQQHVISSFFKKNLYLILIIIILIPFITIFFIISKDKKLDYYKEKITKIENNLNKANDDIVNIKKELNQFKEEFKRRSNEQTP